MPRAWWGLLAVLGAGCALLQPRSVEVGDEQWGVVCRILYTGFGRSTTVYLRLEQHPRPLVGTLVIDDQCRVTIQARPPEPE